MRRCSCLVSALLVGFLVAVPHAQTPSRVVAVGDVHGALDAFVQILQAAGLVDARRQWAGGTATLVQTGDTTDRGADVRGVLDLLMDLEPQARAAGGRVVALVGNHEVMNLLGEYRDVTPAIYATFADASSDERRSAAYEQYAALAAARAKVHPEVAAVYTQPRDSWMAAHPPGWLEYHEAFGPDGRYGAWLRSREVSTRIGSTLFMHAGLSPLATDASLDEVDRRIRDQVARVDRFRRRLVDARLALPFFSLNELLEVAAAEIRAVNAVAAAAKGRGVSPDFGRFDLDLMREAADVVGIGTWDVLAEEGPLWYRGYATTPEASLKAPLAAFFARNRLSRIVVAHSPLASGRITPRMDGAIVLIDTGMLTSVYRGRAAALEIAGDRLTAIYADGRVPLASSGGR